MQCQRGAVLSCYALVYEIYDTLNPGKSNAMLIRYALFGHHHVAEYYAEDENNSAQ